MFVMPLVRGCGVVGEYGREDDRSVHVPEAAEGEHPQLLPVDLAALGLQSDAQVVPAYDKTIQGKLKHNCLEERSTAVPSL